MMDHKLEHSDTNDGVFWPEVEDHNNAPRCSDVPAAASLILLLAVIIVATEIPSYRQFSSTRTQCRRR